MRDAIESGFTICGTRISSTRQKYNFEPPDSFLVAAKVARHNIFQQMISVDLPNKLAGAKMICDVCWIPSQQISDNLADCIIPPFLERVIDAQQICLFSFSIF